MIETTLRKHYQKYCVEPVLRIEALHKIHPSFFTCLACLAGISICPLLTYDHPFYAFVLLLLSGFLDTFDGSLARNKNKTSPQGAALDIVSDRLVEFAIILGLFCVEPALRALPCLLMLGSVLFCVTSFLIVGIFTENSSEKSFYYSPGLMERAEAFVFFGAMILIPASFFVLAYLFSFLVFLTGIIRVVQFLKRTGKNSTSYRI